MTGSKPGPGRGWCTAGAGERPPAAGSGFPRRGEYRRGGAHAGSMFSADPDVHPRPGRQQPCTSSDPDAGTGYREALVRVRARRADERDRIADERDRIADERDRVADEREALADQREQAANQRERQLDARLGTQDASQAGASGQGWEIRDRAAARAARKLAGISREKSASQRAEAARRRAAVVAPYWPSPLDGQAARAEFLAIMQRRREAIAQSQAAVHMARALCESAREAASQPATPRALRARA